MTRTTLAFGRTLLVLAIALIAGGCKKDPATSKSPATASDLKTPRSQPTLTDVREAAGKGDVGKEWMASRNQ